MFNNIFSNKIYVTENVEDANYNHICIIKAGDKKKMARYKCSENLAISLLKPKYKHLPHNYSEKFNLNSECINLSVFHKHTHITRCLNLE